MFLSLVDASQLFYSGVPTLVNRTNRGDIMTGLVKRWMLALAIVVAGGVGVGQLSAAADRQPACDPDNGGITLPAGFCALVAADGIGPARHIAVAPNGDVYVALL